MKQRSLWKKKQKEDEKLKNKRRGWADKSLVF